MNNCICICGCVEIDILEDEIIELEITEGGGGCLPFYTGPYIVEPRRIEQELETQNKSMSQNVTINEIYYAETTNTSGGLTCYIGKE